MAPRPGPAKSSVEYVYSLLISETPPIPVWVYCLPKTNKLKSQASEMMQVPCQPWEAMKHLGNQQGCDVIRRNAWLTGVSGHVTWPVCPGHMGAFPTELSVSDGQPRHNRNCPVTMNSVSHVMEQFFPSKL